MEKKRAKLVSHQLPTIPDHLIVDQILVRLPVKSLVRFKSVSKNWLKTICSDEFQEQHLKLSSLCPQIMIFEYQCCLCPTYLLSIDECNNNVKECVKLEHKYGALNFRYEYNNNNLDCFCFVVGSCNGLVCLFSRESWLYVWNPATNECQNVGYPDHAYPHITETPSMGFGYVSSIDDYKIGFLLYEYGYDITKVDNWRLQACVYSLRARKWTSMTILDDDKLITLSVYQPVVVVDDFQYWSPIVTYYKSYNRNRLLGMNLINGKLKKFELKNNLLNGYKSVHISKIKGCLSLGCVKNMNVQEGFYDRFVCDVWMSKQPHHDPNSWEKVFCVNISDPCLHHLLYFEMGKGKGKGKCLVSQTKGNIKLMDIGEGAQEQDNTFHHQWLKLPIYAAEACDYVESLISPFISYENEDESRERSE